MKKPILGLAMLLGLFISSGLTGCGKTTSSSDGVSYNSLDHLTEPAIVFHYHRDDGGYQNWNLWLWNFNAGEGSAYEMPGRDEYGIYGIYALSTWEDVSELGFIVRKGEWEAKDPSIDRTVKLSEWTPDANQEIHVYLKSGESRLYLDEEGTVFSAITKAYFASSTEISLGLTNQPTKVDVKANGDIVKSVTTFTNMTPTITLDAAMNFSLEYTVDVYFDAAFTDVRHAPVSITKLYDTPAFTSTFNYDGNDLGLTYSAASSTFKVWAPISTSMALRVYNSGTPVSVSATLGNDDYVSYDMVKGDKGVWSTTVSGDLNGKYYTYYVTNGSTHNEVVDPYAKAAGISGLRGMILDLDSTDPEGWDQVSFSDIDSSTDLSIYELHIRDLTMDDTWNGSEANRGKYLGMIESGTTYTSGSTTVTTGFDHIKELGVNAIQILPFFDQANDETKNAFNWGYNPLNYNVLEGSYSSDPYDGAVRIREAKQMIQGLAQADIRVIMDVVYNHVAGLTSSNFEKLVPGYYFRFTSSGTPSSGSGCGNDTASERAMFRKFMIDSTAFLASEYKLGGYRFDLMGLHDVETMNQVVTSLKSINEDMAIYGEPWNMTTSTTATLTTQANLNQVPELAGFNDKIRDNIKGSYSSIGSEGWLQKASPGAGMVSDLTNGFKGALNTTVVDPEKSLNYVSCHDNATLYDKITHSGIAEADAPKVDVQAQTMIFTSQGIPFMQAGEELMRIKHNSDDSVNQNSYNASDEVNSLKWDRKITYKDYYDKYVELIALRKAHPIFRYSTSAIASANYTPLTTIGETTLTGTTLAFRMTKDASISDRFSEIVVIHNGNNEGVTLSLTSGPYKVAYKSDSSDIVGSSVASISLAKNVSIVLYKE